MNKQERNKAKVSIKKSIEETQKDISNLKEITKPISPEMQLGGSAEWTPLTIKVLMKLRMKCD